MTSGSDDLEQELRRNLKLRLELGAEAAEGKAALSAKLGGGIAYRVGWGSVLGLSRAYWFVCSFLVGGLTRRILGSLDYSPWVGRSYCRALCARSSLPLPPLRGVTASSPSQISLNDYLTAI